MFDPANGTRLVIDTGLDSTAGENWVASSEFESIKTVSSLVDPTLLLADIELKCTSDMSVYSTHITLTHVDFIVPSLFYLKPELKPANFVYVLPRAAAIHPLA